MTKFKVFSALCLSVVMASSASAATVSYRFLIDGAETPAAPTPLLLTSGEHTLTVQAQVTDNMLTPTIAGGLFQAAINLDTAGGDLQWDPEMGIFGPTGNWEATFNSNFATQLKGVLGGNGHAVFAHTGAVNPGSYPTLATAVAANTWTEVTSGKFNYNGGTITLSLSAAMNEQLVAGLSGSTPIGRFPETVVGTSVVLGIPEPAAVALFGMSSLGLIAIRRRFV
jgi:hypothetical protein